MLLVTHAEISDVHFWDDGGKLGRPIIVMISDKARVVASKTELSREV